MSERILATVLFTDIVGSTERAAALGDRRWRELKARHHALVRRELARCGGAEVDTAGDGFLVTFDRPLLAIRCACAIRDAVRSLGLEIRAGLHAGEVEREGGGVTGIAVHIGARVAAQADAGEVLVSGTVRDLVAGSGLQFEDRGVQTLRGVPGDWRLFAVLDPGGEDKGDAGSPAGGSRRTPFVGRQQELAALVRCLDAAGRGQGQLVLVAGEPGIGKTRLLAELAERAQAEGWQVLAGNAYDSEGMPPYLPFTEALRDYVRAAPLDALRAQLDETGPEVALLAPDLRRRLPDLVASPPASPEEQRYRLFESVTDFLFGIPAHSEARGLVLILDDLHWAEQSSVLLLQHVARRLASAPLLLVGAYRTVEVSRGHPLAALLAEQRRSDDWQRLELAPLAAEEVAALVQGMAGSAPAAAVVEAIARQTDGNPLFVGEVVRHLLAEGRDLTAGEAATAVAAVPEGVQELIDHRLERLSATTNGLLRMAAVLGDGFSFETLQAAMGDESTGLLDVLDEALTAGMLHEVGGGYHFSHALIRRALYDGLGLARRQRLHQQVARILEERYAGPLGDHAGELAGHFAQSTDRADLAKAIRYSELAARRALSVYAYGEAVRHLEQALRVLEVLDPDDGVRRCDLLLALGDVLQAVGEPLRAAREAATDALACATAAGDQERALRACQLAIRALSQLGGAAGGSEFREWAEQADRRAQPESAERAQLDVDMSRVLFTERRFRSAWQRVASAQELARRLGDLEARYRAAATPSIGPSGPGEAGLRAVIAELSIGSRVGVSPRALNFFLFEAGCSLLGWGDLREAERLFQELRELATKTRYPSALQRAALLGVLTSTLAGGWEDALARAESFMGQAEELGNPSWAWVNFASGITRIRLSLGRADEALACVDAAIPSAEAQASVRTALRALCLAALGRLDEARTVAAPVLDPQGLGPEADYAPTYLVTLLLEVAVLLQDREAVTRLSAQLSGVSDQVTVRQQLSATAVGRHLGAAAALLGDPEAARGYYDQALQVCHKIAFRPEIALTRLGIAELLLGHADAMNRAPTPGGVAGVPLSQAGPPLPIRGEGEASAPEDTRAEALDHLDFAIAEFREMKMQPSLERALRHKELLKA